MPKIVKLPFKLYTLNEYIHEFNKSRWGANTIKQNSTKKCVPFFSGKKFKTPIEVEILWVLKDRRKDFDNVAFAKKFIFDAMVDAGSIPNDTQKYVTGTRGEHITVGLEECVLIKIFEEGE